MYATGVNPNYLWADKKVYGLPMTVRAYKSALSFMHAQTGLCALITCGSVLGLTFSVILSLMLKDTVEKANDVNGQGKGLDTAGTTSTGGGNTNAAWIAVTFGSTMQYAWLGGLFSVIFMCFIGSVLVYIARHMLEKRSSDGLRFCCLFEGAFSCCYLLSALAIAVHVVLLVTVVSGFDDPKKYCDMAYQKGTASELQFSKHYENCIAVVPVIKNGLIVFAVWLSCALCLNFCASFLCGLGAKYAKETEKAFDEEYYSGVVGQPYY